MAQINGRNSLSWPERIQWDVKYVDSASLSLDISILARTVWVILSGYGVGGHPLDDPIANPEVSGGDCRMTRIYLSPPDVGPLEREYLLRAFDSGWVAPLGPEVDGFRG